MDIHTHIQCINPIDDSVDSVHKIMIGSPLAEQFDVAGEIPDVIAIPQQGFYKYNHTTQDDIHIYTKVYGIVLQRH